jgi:hypothetical protein
MRIDYAERARALVGRRFRPQGRGAEGLDCVGVVLETFGIDASLVRRDYRLRGDHRHELHREMQRQFRAVPRRHARAGDVMVMRAGEAQQHLGIRTVNGFVHAHAGIGGVVETPGEPQWPVLRVYRKRTRMRRR